MPLRVAIIGTGLTGAPIAARQRSAGREVAVFDRERARAEALRGEGVAVAESPAAAVRAADAVGIVVMDERAVDAVLGGDEGILAGLRPDALVVDLTTTGVEATKRFATRVEAEGGRYAKAPFFGSRAEAERGALFVTAGAAEQDRTALEEFLRPVAADVFHVGDPAAAAAFKLAANALVFTMVLNIAEALALARAQSVDGELLLAALERGTGVRAPLYAAKGRLILDGDYAPRFTVEGALKDLDLIAAAAERAGLRLPANETALSVFRQAAAAGLGGEDMAAVYKLLERP